MLRLTTISIALAIGASPAWAESWSVGVGFGAPVYYGPPPVVYGPPGVVYRSAPPVYYYGQAPLVVEPRDRYRDASPAEVLDRLERAGYREFGPMAERGDHYSLSAVSPDGDIVALEVSVYSGDIEREFILEERRQKRRARAVAPPPPVVDTAPPPPPRVVDTTPAPPRVVDTTPPRPRAPETSAASSTMRDRLRPAPPQVSAEEETGSDPLVVY